MSCWAFFSHFLIEHVIDVTPNDRIQYRCGHTHSGTASIMAIVADKYWSVWLCLGYARPVYQRLNRLSQSVQNNRGLSIPRQLTSRQSLLKSTFHMVPCKSLHTINLERCSK
jgi:hypothetical protein